MEFREISEGFEHFAPAAIPPHITDAEAEAGARFAVNLFRLWDVTDAQSCVLLGGLGARTYARWKKGHIGPIDTDRNMRLSLLAGIHKGLQFLFSEPPRRYAWLKKHNAHFDGLSPLDVMLRGQMTDLMDIRAYLDAARG